MQRNSALATGSVHACHKRGVHNGSQFGAAHTFHAARPFGLKFVVFCIT